MVSVNGKHRTGVKRVLIVGLFALFISLMISSSISGAPGDPAIEVIAELAIRLKRLGHSGELLLAELQAGMEGNLTSEADAAFHYITGNHRKVDSYPHWKANRKYNNKGKNTQT